MPGYRTALGVDITESRIDLALLKKQGDSIKLVKAASCPVPDGAVRDGNIENAAALARAIRKLKIRNGIRVHPTAVSLIANPTLTQILELPKNVTGNIRQFVNNEVKHYAKLPLKKAAVDFCGLTSLSISDCRRALVVATDGEKVANVTKMMIRQGLDIVAIEPAWTAYTRACYAKVIADKAQTNLLFATVFDGILTLSLFSENSLDFIRVKPVEPELSESEEYFKWLEEEINEVLKFYKFGSAKKSGKWQITIVANIDDKTAKKKTELLRTRFESVELQIRTLENAYIDTPVAKDIGDIKPSAAAIGLAMGLLNVPGHGLNINLLPSEVIMAKSREKHTLLIANIAAVVFALMIVCIGILQAKAENVAADIRQQEQTQVTHDTQGLLKEQVVLDKQITEVKSKLEFMDNALSFEHVPMWNTILNDIRVSIPETVWVTEIFSEANSKIVLHGQALSYEDVYSFIEALGSCKNIRSATLLGSQNNGRSDGQVEYSISCVLVQ